MGSAAGTLVRTARRMSQVAKKPKKSSRKGTAKKSSKKKSTGKKKPKRKTPKKSTRKKSAKRSTKRKSSATKAAAPPPVEPEPDVEPQPPEEPRTPPAPARPKPQEPDFDEPEPRGASPEEERPWASDDVDETRSDPWDEPEEPPTRDPAHAEPSPWESPEPAPPREEQSPWTIPETPPKDPEPMPPEEPEADPWPSPDDDVVTAEPAPPPEPEPPEEPPEPAPWQPVTEEPPPADPEATPPADEEATTTGWQVRGTRERAAAETDEPRRGWPTKAPGRDELRDRFSDASVRMGLPPMAALGWAIFFVGLVLMTYAYYDVYAGNEESVLLFAGAIRYDVLGAILLILGLVTAAVFHFVPTRRPHGPQPDDSPTAWVAGADRAARWVTTHRTLSLIGWGVAIFGLAIATIALYYSWLNSNGGLVDYGITIGGRQFLYWRLGAVLAFVGLIVVGFTYTRIRNAREAHQGYLLAALAALDRQRVVQQAASEAKAPSAQTPAPPAHRPEPASEPVAGVPEEELRALMRKLDGLMSSLPEEQVAEFANSREAETYLSLLESSK